jgi:hypothetical protein
METIQEHLKKELGSDKVRSIRGAEGPAGDVPFEKGDDPPHQPYQGYNVERSFNRGKVLLILDDRATKRWEASQVAAEDGPSGTKPKPTLRLIFSDRRADEPDSDFYDPLEDLGLE